MANQEIEQIVALQQYVKAKGLDKNPLVKDLMKYIPQNDRDKNEYWECMAGKAFKLISEDIRLINTSKKVHYVYISKVLTGLADPKVYISEAWIQTDNKTAMYVAQERDLCVPLVGRYDKWTEISVDEFEAACQRIEKKKRESAEIIEELSK